jgi:hypothetical protein
MDPRAIAFLAGCDAAIIVVGSEAEKGEDGSDDDDDPSSTESIASQFARLAACLPVRGRQQHQPLQASPGRPDQNTQSQEGRGQAQPHIHRQDRRTIPVVVAQAMPERAMRRADIRDAISDVGLDDPGTPIREWMAVKMDTSTLAGLNEALLWLLERTTSAR